jgi:hypothetical protein
LDTRGYGFEICCGVLYGGGAHIACEQDIVGRSEVISDVGLFQKLEEYFCYGRLYWGSRREPLPLFIEPVAELKAVLVCSCVL